ncbi:MAG: M13 family metallopeptidase [Lachnospiraceae bacterium]|nr:M13 family metallopeptidase [Lachnospiraceae bacterium]
MKKRIFNTRGISALFLASVILTGTLNGCTVSTTSPGQTPETTEEETLFSSGRKVYVAGDPMSFTISPKDDFYGSVNAEALWNTEIGYGDQSAGAFNEVYGSVEEEVDSILKEILAEGYTAEKGSPEEVLQKVAKLLENYQGNEENMKIFKEVFSKIDSASTPEELIYLAAEMAYRYDTNSLLTTAISTDSRNTSKNALTLTYSDTIFNSLQEMNEDTKKAEAFRDALLSALYDLGMDKNEASTVSYRITHRYLELSMEIDFTAMEKEGMENYITEYRWKEAEELFGTISLEEMLRHGGFSDEAIDTLKAGKIRIALPEVLKGFVESVNDETLEDWKNYLKCCFTSKYSLYKPEGYTRMDQRTKDITEEEEFRLLKNDFGTMISPIYYSEVYTEEKAAIMKEMEEAFRSEYPAMIREADYLSEETKEALVKKFENITFHYGGESYENSLIAGIDPVEDTYLETVLTYNRKINDRIIESLCEATDPDRWEMTAQTVNAYYQPYSNDIYITTAILHAPFFDQDAELATNLGGIGTVIAHELSHAFDSNGLQYDENGNYAPEWIGEADRKVMEERQEAIRKHYDKYTLLDVYHVDGEQTLAENMADLGGVQCVLRMLSGTEEYKKYFTNYAKIWSTLYRKENILMYLDEDVHSPDPIRVNAVVSCFPEFYETYDVREGDGMYLAPEERPSRW